LAEELFLTRYTTYQKFRYRGVVDLMFDRSRFFTFVFFMLKIFRIKPCENNKSCGISLAEPRKIGLEVF
jgi:hypothetical protein